MDAYKYSPLNEHEIRLIKLLPGEVDDEIRFNIVHTPLLHPPADPPSRRLSKQELQKTLIDDWRVYETP